MKILFIGDVFGKAGRQILTQKLPDLIKKEKSDLIIANVENICHGKGTRYKDVLLLKSLGINIFTGGNHTFDNKEIFKVFEKEPYVLRPANYPQGVPGKGYCVFQDVLVINLLGRVFLKEGLDSPFQVINIILKKHQNTKLKAIIVDFHAETTSEKQALFHYLDGQVSALFGTHTHVQTADERISSQGTAFITDVGFTGPEDSIIGMEKDVVLQKFLTALPAKFKPSEKNKILCAVSITVNNKKAEDIKRIYLR